MNLRLLNSLGIFYKNYIDNILIYYVRNIIMAEMNELMWLVKINFLNLLFTVYIIIFQIKIVPFFLKKKTIDR